jgi:hypothetical protein
MLVQEARGVSRVGPIVSFSQEKHQAVLGNASRIRQVVSKYGREVRERSVAQPDWAGM